MESCARGAADRLRSARRMGVAMRLVGVVRAGVTAAVVPAIGVARGTVVGAAAAILCVGVAQAADSLVGLVQAKDHAAAVAVIAKGADVRERSADGTTALHWAVYNDDVDLVQRLIGARADVSAVNDYGASVLRQAATVADPVVIKALLKAGANANESNAEGETPLMVVARSGNIESAKRCC